MVKGANHKVKSLKKQIKKFANNPEMVRRFTGRLKGVEGTLNNKRR